MLDFELDCERWLYDQIDKIIEDISYLTPSQIAEKYRYLAPSSTAIPGYFSYDVTPFWKEVVNCLGSQSPIREVAVMKGVQVGFTTAVLENAILYAIMETKSAPCMLLTSTIELAQHRLDTYIIPMLEDSGLGDVIMSADAENARKTGKTKKKLEWRGGGFLLPYGAQSAHKLRSTPVRDLFRDEVDGYPLRVGNDGDPMALSMARTQTFEQTRKILDGSTPLIKGESLIEQRFLEGDQRYWNVPCKKCGELQVLEWNKVNKDTGALYGLHFSQKDGRLVKDSVRYYCKHCGHPHTNDDKAWMLPRGEWRATAEPKHPFFRSYHLSALYSPAGNHSWESVCQAWLDAWDTENNKPRNIQKLQVFYNNELGIPFKKQTDRLRLTHVSSHRRSYRYGEIPNYYAIQYVDSPILVVLCTVDVQGDELSTAVWGWAKNSRLFLIDYWMFHGDTSNIEDPGSWGELRKLIEGKIYVADDGKKYRIALTLIDSGDQTKVVYTFCSYYEKAVYAIKGVSKVKQAEEFKVKTAALGVVRVDINVDIYKNTMNENLRHYWDEANGDQPDGHFNAPSDITNKQLKELTAEYAEMQIDPKTNQKQGLVWHRNKNVRNELWDLMVYANAGIDIVAYDYYRVYRTPKGEKPEVNWPEFWHICGESQLYFET